LLISRATVIRKRDRDSSGKRKRRRCDARRELEGRPARPHHPAARCDRRAASAIRRFGGSLAPFVAAAGELLPQRGESWTKWANWPAGSVTFAFRDNSTILWRASRYPSAQCLGDLPQPVSRPAT